MHPDTSGTIPEPLPGNGSAAAVPSPEQIAEMAMPDLATLLHDADKPALTGRQAVHHLQAAARLQNQADATMLAWLHDLGRRQRGSADVAGVYNQYVEDASIK